MSRDRKRNHTANVEARNSEFGWAAEEIRRKCLYAVAYCGNREGIYVVEAGVGGVETLGGRAGGTAVELARFDERGCWDVGGT